jgi:hypothetical protein
MKASDLKPGKNIFGLFIGKSGSGKDCAAASFPAPMKIFDLDLRSDGILGATWFPREHLEKIDIIKVQPKKGFQMIEEELELLKRQYEMGQRPYETIYFGSVTTLESLFLGDARRLLDASAGKKVHQIVGKVEFGSPADYKYLYSAMRETMDYLRIMPVNVILSAHIVDRYGKNPAAKTEYEENIVLGEKLTLTDKLSENIQIYFNEVYRFEKRMNGNEPRHYVKFRTDVAKTVHQSLPNGELDITSKNFYNEWSRLIQKEKVA